MSTVFPGGLDTFINPTEADKLNGNPNPLLTHVSQHTNLNDGMAAVQAKLGTFFSNINTSDDYKLQILMLMLETHNLGLYKRVSGGTPAFPTNKIWYTDNGMSIKLIEKIITYQPTKKIIQQVSYLLYDGTIANTVKRQIIDTPIYYNSTPFEESITRVIV